MNLPPEFKVAPVLYEVLNYAELIETKSSSTDKNDNDTDGAEDESYMYINMKMAYHCATCSLLVYDTIIRFLLVLSLNFV